MRRLILCCSVIAWMQAPAIARAQEFGRIVAFGDSLTDNGRLAREAGAAPGEGRFTNGRVWPEILGARLGAGFAAADGYAIGGARTGIGLGNGPAGQATGFLTQIADFAARDGRLGPRDVGAVWIGTNDLWTAALAGRDMRATAAMAAANTLSGLQQLQRMGAREIALLGVYDLGRSAVNTRFPAGSPNYAALASLGSQEFNARLASTVLPGVNVYFLDTRRLVERIIADPGRFGFSNVSAVANCLASGCAALSLPEQNRFLFWDTIHLTDGAQDLIGRYSATQIQGPRTIAMQGDLGLLAVRGMTGAVQQRLDLQPYASLAPGGWRVFADTSVAIGRQDSGTGALRHDDSLFGMLLGAEYASDHGMLYGAAFGASWVRGDLDDGAGATSGQAWQFLLYASHQGPALVLDATLAAGVGTLDIRRAGIVEDMTASPGTTMAGAAIRAGYLFGLGPIRIGPVAGASYARAGVASYAEAGDALLAQTVAGQSVGGWILSGGIEIRTPAAARTVAAFLRLTVEHETTQRRDIEASLQAAPLLPLRVSVEDPAQTYGRVAFGAAVALAGALEASFGASATLARDAGNIGAVRLGLLARF